MDRNNNGHSRVFCAVPSEPQEYAANTRCLNNSLLWLEENEAQKPLGGWEMAESLGSQRISLGSRFCYQSVYQSVFVLVGRKEDIPWQLRVHILSFKSSSSQRGGFTFHLICLEFKTVFLDSSQVIYES